MHSPLGVTCPQASCILIRQSTLAYVITYTYMHSKTATCSLVFLTFIAITTSSFILPVLNTSESMLMPTSTGKLMIFSCHIIITKLCIYYVVTYLYIYTYIHIYIYIYIYTYLIVIPWVRVVCLLYTPEPRVPMV